jgi:hypothetical protein
MTNSDKFRDEWNKIEKYLCSNAGIDIDGDERDEGRRLEVASHPACLSSRMAGSTSAKIRS